MANLLNKDEEAIVSIMQELEVYEKSGNDEGLRYHSTWAEYKIHFDKSHEKVMIAHQLWHDDHPPTDEEYQELVEHLGQNFRF